MGMPNHLVLVRHGESEANLGHRLEEAGKPVPEEFRKRHDWEHPLTEKGIRQAKIAGEWITNNIGDINDYFNIRYVSHFIRARETAIHLGDMACRWLPDGRLIERAWGTYGAEPFETRAETFARTEAERERSSYYSHYDNGESIGYNTVIRTRDWFATLHRDAAGKKVIAATHGEFMWSVMAVVENMLPEEWEEARDDEDESQKIKNGTIVDYSRVNPTDSSEINNYLRWRRITYPDNPSKSPFGGEWQEIPGKRYISGTELAESVNKVKRLF